MDSLHSPGAGEPSSPLAMMVVMVVMVVVMVVMVVVMAFKGLCRWSERHG